MDHMKRQHIKVCPRHRSVGIECTVQTSLSAHPCWGPPHRAKTGDGKSPAFVWSDYGHSLSRGGIRCWCALRRQVGVPGLLQELRPADAQCAGRPADPAGDLSNGGIGDDGELAVLVVVRL